MDTKVTLFTKDKTSATRFTPKLDETNLVAHLNNFLDTFPQALLKIFGELPCLRPATKEEVEAHIYVFPEGEQGEIENHVYKFRKQLYTQVSALLSQILTTAFPDIEYIEQCSKYAQELAFDDDEEKKKEHEETVKKLTLEVRKNYDKLVSEVCNDAR